MRRTGAIESGEVALLRPSFAKAIHERLPVGKTFLLFLFLLFFAHFAALSSRLAAREEWTDSADG